MTSIGIRSLMLALVAGLALSPGLLRAQDLVRNGTFSQAGSPPSAWVIDGEAARKGAVSVLPSLGNDQGVLELTPNSRNTPSSKPLGIGQAIDISETAGRTLLISARLGLRAPAAAAVVGAHALRANGSEIAFVHLRRAEAGEGLATSEGKLAIPAGEQPKTLILFAVAEGVAGAALFDDIVVRMSSDQAAPAAPAPAAAAPTPGGSFGARVTIDAAKRGRRIPPDLYGVNIEWFRNANGLWDEGRDRLQPDLLRMSRELGATLIRFPGGFLSDTYDWRDGIGPRPQRPSRPSHPKTTERNKNTFGTGEVTDFASAIGANLLFTVNLGTGKPDLAAEWVRHMAAETAKRGGRPQVTWWELGNELYHKGDLSGGALPPETYADRVVEFARAMRAVDPTVRLGAIGLENFANFPFNDHPRWNEIVLRRAGASIDFFAVHNAYAPGAPDARADGRVVYEALLAAPLEIAENIRTTAGQLERFLPADRAKSLPLAITEWGALFHVSPDSPWVDHVKTLGSALYIADTLRVFIASDRVGAATFFKLNEPSFMGLMGARRGEWIANASYFAMQLYTRHFGSIVVDNRAESPGYDSRRIGILSARRGVPLVSSVASVSADGATLYVILINKSLDRSADVDVAIENAAPISGIAWTLTGGGPDAHNGAELPRVPGLRWADQNAVPPWNRFGRGTPGEVKLTNAPIPDAGAKFRHRVPPHSAVSLALRLKP